MRYALNLESTLKKKKSATERPEICIATEKGSGVIIECQAGIYELLRRAALIYFTENSRSDRSIDIELCGT